MLRLAQQNIAARRAGLRTPIGATPGSFETPGASILRGPFGGGGMTTYLTTPASTPVLQRGPVEGQRDPLGHTHPSGGAVDGRDAPGEDGPDGAVRQAPPMSLDRCGMPLSAGREFAHALVSATPVSASLPGCGSHYWCTDAFSSCLGCTRVDLRMFVFHAPCIVA